MDYSGTYSGAKNRRPEGEYSNVNPSFAQGVFHQGDLDQGGVTRTDGEVASSNDDDEEFVPIKFDGDKNALFKAIENSYRNLEDHRLVNKTLVETYANFRNTRSGKEANGVRYMNLMNQAVEAYQTMLAANRPRVMVNTHYEELYGFATLFEQAMNAFIGEIGLEETIRQWVMDAFFYIGIVKVHMADAGMIELEPDLWMDPGKPFASNVSLDDFVFDITAKKPSEAKFMGDLYRLPFADVVEMYGEEATADLTPNSKYADNDDRIESISRGQSTDHDEFEPMIDLADIWVPRHGMIYTFAVDNRREFQLKGEPLAAIEWTGNEHGPYPMLYFDDVPENIIPASPAGQLEPMDALINDLMRKCARQAKRQKNITTYTADSEAAARAVKSASDGDMIGVQDTDGVKQLAFGGTDQGTYGFMIGAVEIFDRMAGNLTALMGLGTSAGTVGQEKLIHGAVGKKAAQMQYYVQKAVTTLIKSLGQMMWEDAFLTIDMQYEVTETLKIPMQWNPHERAGDFLDYNFTIDVYSMQYQSPAEKMEQLNSLVTQIFIPMMEPLMMQGGMIDFQEYTKTVSKLMNLPELKQIVKFGTPYESGPRPFGKIPSAPMANNTTRNYVRRSESGGNQTAGASAMAMMQGSQSGQQQQPQGA